MRTCTLSTLCLLTIMGALCAAETPAAQSSPPLQSLDQRFAALHLSPAPSLHGFQQNFQIALPARPSSDCRLDFGTNIHATLARDFLPLPISAAGKFAGPLIFAGYGISAQDQFGYDDYADLDVRGKVVLILRYEPHDANGRSRFADGDSMWSDYSTLRRKIQTAHYHGAAAVLLACPPNYHADDGLLTHSQDPWQFRQDDSSAALPAAEITIALANRLLASAKTSLQKLQAAIDESGAAHGLLIPNANVSGNVDFKVDSVRASNCVAMLNGAGPMANQWIVVALENAVNNDPNDLSEAVYLDVIHRILPKPAPARSILFVGFPGKDHGSAGAVALITSSPIPLDRIVAVVEIGDVQRMDESKLQIQNNLSIASATSLASSWPSSATMLPLEMLASGALVCAEHNVLALRLSSVPQGDRYSSSLVPTTQPSEASSVSAVDPTVIANIGANIVAALTTMPANDLKPTPLSDSPLTQPHRMAWLGIVPDPTASDSSVGVVVQGTLPDSPAVAAGIQNGDLLVQCNGRQINCLSDLNAALLAAAPEEVVHLKLLRGDSQVSLDVKLAQTPGR